MEKRHVSCLYAYEASHTCMATQSHPPTYVYVQEGVKNKPLLIRVWEDPSVYETGQVKSSCSSKALCVRIQLGHTLYPGPYMYE